MARDVFEESTIKPRAWIARGVNRAGNATFVFFKDNREVARKAAQISATAVATVDYACPKVDDDKENYALRFEVETPFGKLKDNPEYTVWPKKISLHAVEDADRANMKGCQFVLKQLGAADNPAKTLADGKIEVDLKTPSAFTVAAVPPFEIKSWETGTGRNRKVKVLRHFTAAFLLPNKSRQSVKQWVNLVTALDGQDELGEIVKFEVSVKEDHGKPQEDWIGRANDKIFIEINFSRASKRNDPKPELTDAQAITPSDSDKTYKGHVLLGADGKATFKVNFGLAGGDHAIVKIGSTDAAADDTITFDNWRRLYYELIYPDFMAGGLSDTKAAKDNSDKKDLPAALKTKVKERLNPAFVDYVLWDSQGFAKASAIADTVVTKEYLESAAGRDERLILGPGISTAATDPVAFTCADPRSLHMSLCDLAFYSDGTLDTHEPVLRATTGAVTPAADKYYFKKSFGSGVDALKLVGCNWTAVVTAADAQGKTSLVIDNEAAPDPTGAPNGVVRLLETAPGASSVDLPFKKPMVGHISTEVSADAVAALDGFLNACLANRAGLRGNGNVIRIHIVAEVGDGSDAKSTLRRTTRFNNVKRVLRERLDALKASVAVHPGLNDDESPRSGIVQAAWIGFETYRRIKVTLPAGAGDQPGDFVGALSTTKCPVKVKFKIMQHFGINGCAGGGRQIMVIRPDAEAGACSSTVCHELGHSMGMSIMAARSKVPPGMDPALHVDNGGLYYLNGNPDGASGLRNCGVGPHCAVGVANIAAASFNGDPGTCILYHAGGAGDTRPSYCPTCRDYIKGRKLVDLRTAWNARAATDY